MGVGTAPWHPPSPCPHPFCQNIHRKRWESSPLLILKHNDIFLLSCMFWSCGATWEPCPRPSPCHTVFPHSLPVYPTDGGSRFLWHRYKSVILHVILSPIDSSLHSGSSWILQYLWLPLTVSHSHFVYT